MYAFMSYTMRYFDLLDEFKCEQGIYDEIIQKYA